MTNEVTDGVTDGETEWLTEGGKLSQGAKFGSTAERLVLVLWGMGFLICMGILTVSLWKNKHKFSDAIRIEGNVYAHSQVETSFVSGIFSPKIYISSNLRKEEYSRRRELILYHERVHVKRRDYLWKLVSYIAFSILWFNPLSWIAYHMLVLDMEVSCDEAVIRRLGSRARKEYSYLLLSMTEDKKRRMFLEPAFSMSAVKERIVSVMKYHRPGKIATVFSVVIVILCSCGIASKPETVKELPAANQGEEKSTKFQEDMADFNDLIAQYEEKSGENVKYLNHDADENGMFYIVSLQGKDRKPKEYAKLKYEDGACIKETYEWSDAAVAYNEKLGEYWMPLEPYFEKEDVYFSSQRYNVSVYSIGQGNEKSSYITQNLLVKYDASTGKMIKFKVPQIKAKEIYSDDSKGIAANTYEKIEENRVLIMNSRKLFGWYDLNTGKCLDSLEDVSQELNYALDGKTSEDIIAVLSQKNGKTLEVNVYDIEDGKYQYTIPTDIKVSDMNALLENNTYFWKLDIHDDKIYLLTKEGVDAVEVGDDVWEKVMEPKESKLYYFTEDRMSISFFRIIDESKFYIFLWRDTTSLGTQVFDCCYTRSEN